MSEKVGAALMGRSQQERYLELKTQRIESYQKRREAEAIAQLERQRAQVAKQLRQHPVIHDLFLTDDDSFDPYRAAALLNDYEVDLLKDLDAHPEADLVLGKVGLTLQSRLGVIKEYELEYGRQLGLFLSKGLLELVSSDRFRLNARGAAVLAHAKELAEKEVEQWEMWRGMPSLYHLNRLEF